MRRPLRTSGTERRVIEEWAPLRLERPPPIDGLEIVLQPGPSDAAGAAVTFVAPAGSGFDPRGAEGTAGFALRTMAAAAGPWPRRELARRLDRLGATLTAHLDPESAEIGLRGPREAGAEMLAILATVVLHPRWDRSDRDRIRREIRERQLRERTQPSARAEIELWRATYPPDHPYRESGAGTPRSVARIDRDALVRFWAGHFVARGSRLVATGLGRSSRVLPAVRRRFRELDRSTAVPRPELPSARGRSTIVRVPMPDRSQVELRVGGPSLPRDDPRYPALFLAHEVVGGRPLLSRLFQRLREREGLVYHASTELESMRWGGYWSAQAGCAPRRWPRTLRRLRAELRRMVAEGPDPRELDRIRESAIRELPLSLETASQAHELALEVAYHDLPTDFWRSWGPALRAVRPAEVRAAAAAGLDERSSVAVVAGSLGPPAAT